MERYDIRDFYVSPLGRARDTAAYTLERMHREAEVLPWLKEFSGKYPDPETGKAPECWGRAMGWYLMALVDVIELLPAGEEQDALVRIFGSCFQALPLFADRKTGMWYQVLDRPYAEGNYLEATASAMIVYSWLKGCRLGIIGNREGAVQAFDSLLKTFVRVDEDGLVNLDQCCEVAGLGGKNISAEDIRQIFEDLSQGQQGLHFVGTGGEAG